MLWLGATYLIVRDIDKSINFYSKLLEMEPTAKTFNRWIQFDFGNKCIALYNNDYDVNRINTNDNLEKHYNDVYIKYINEHKIIYGNNMILNFWVEDLLKEYQRLKELNIGVLSEIMYVNISSPYHFFVINDPDNNEIEITGGIK